MLQKWEHYDKWVDTLNRIELGTISLERKLGLYLLQKRR